MHCTKWLIVSVISFGLGAACGDDGNGSGGDDGSVADAGPLVDSGPLPDAPPASPPTYHSIVGGAFENISGGEEGGRVVLMRTDQGTIITVHANGLTENTDYNVRLHRWPCAVDDGGTAYLEDPTLDNNADNRVELMMSLDADESFYNVWRQTSHDVRRDALSVVVRTGGERIMCADLAVDDVEGTDTATGTFAPFAAAGIEDMTIDGTGEIVRNFDAGETTVNVDLSGLNDGEMYTAHVHEYPCAVMDAGAHYLVDPSMAAGETNELWPTISVNGDGTATDSFTEAIIAREDAQSIVIHRIDGENAPKVACADIHREGYPDFVTEGPFDKFGMGAPINGTGTLARQMDGNTSAELAMEDLEANTDYTAHVHALPCAIGDGGAHYMIDSDGPADETNELWLDFSTDGDGIGTASTSAQEHIAFAAAQSIVVHEPGGDRLGCIDLD